jgi:hypothetical protein
MKNIFDEEVQSKQEGNEKFWAGMSDMITEERVESATPQRAVSLMLEDSHQTDIRQTSLRYILRRLGATLY